MTCIRIEHGFVCSSNYYRLRLNDGRYIYMMYHHYLGPMFFEDKLCKREIDNWYEDKEILGALIWFQNRGNRA